MEKYVNANTSLPCKLMYTRENRNRSIVCLIIFLKYLEWIYYRKPEGMKLLHSAALEAFPFTAWAHQPKKPALCPDL